KIFRRPADLRAGGTVLLVERRRVFDADPDPGAGLPLPAAAEVDPRVPAPHVGEVIASPGSVLESEDADVVPHARGHVLDAQDRFGALERSPRHGVSTPVRRPRRAARATCPQRRRRAGTSTRPTSCCTT